MCRPVRLSAGLGDIRHRRPKFRIRPVPAHSWRLELDLNLDTLSDRLVGAQQYRLGDRDANGSGGLHVDHQLKLGRPFNWQVTRCAAVEDLDHIRRCAPAQIGITRAVAHQPAGVDILRGVVDRRYAQ